MCFFVSGVWVPFLLALFLWVCMVGVGVVLCVLVLCLVFICSCFFFFCVWMAVVLELDPTVTPRCLIPVSDLQTVRFDCVCRLCVFLVVESRFLSSAGVVIVSIFVFVLLFLFFALHLDDL